MPGIVSRPVHSRVFMKDLSTLLFLLLWSVPGITQEAERLSGHRALSEMKEGLVILRLPGFDQKLHLLDSLLATPELNAHSARRLEDERDLTLYQRDLIWKWYPVFFDSVFTYADFGVIAARDTENFENGKISAKTSQGKPVDPGQYESFFYITLVGMAGDDFLFSGTDHKALSYPFPAYVDISGFLLPDLIHVDRPEWMSEFDNKRDVYRIYAHVHRLNKKLHKLYSRYYAD